MPLNQVLPSTTDVVLAPSFGVADVVGDAKQKPLGRSLGASERDFQMLSEAFRSSGGLARGHDLALWLEQSRRGDLVSLARLISAREVFALEWLGTWWVPMCQFEPSAMSLKSWPAFLLAELNWMTDDWDTALWWVQPNAWLGERRPVDLLPSELAAVLQAARADRFVAKG